MIIKSHIRGGYRAAADYLKDQGKNEKIRLVEISDPSAKNLDDAFHNMWVLASNTKATKPLHHISINPMKGERLTDKQVMAVVARCEEKYGYKMFHHQRVIVEHVKDGRQHFHVVWNRVSLMTGKTVWPGEHWKKSKQVCREMEVELGLMRPTPRRAKPVFKAAQPKPSRKSQSLGRYSTLNSKPAKTTNLSIIKPRRRLSLADMLGRISVKRPTVPHPADYHSKPFRPTRRRGRGGKIQENPPITKNWHIKTSEQEAAELIAWAFEQGRLDILAHCGIFLPPDYFEP